jgi:hypothetical protein
VYSQFVNEPGAGAAIYCHSGATPRVIIDGGSRFSQVGSVIQGAGPNRLVVNGGAGPGGALSSDGNAMLTVTNSSISDFEGPAISLVGSGSVSVDTVTVLSGWGASIFSSESDERRLSVTVRNLTAVGGVREAMRIVGHAAKIP